MAVKILIKRIVPDEKAKKLSVLLRQLRTLTTNQEGYISGETLSRFDKPGENIVISTWQSVDNWRNWVISKERTELQEKIDDLLGTKTEYEIYKYV